MTVNPSADRQARRPQASPAVWRAGELDPTAWTVRLNESQRAAIVTAARTAPGDHVALTALASSVSDWSHALSDGPGFVLLRGFPVDQLSDEEIEYAYIALGTMLGQPVAQNAAGELLTHVRDERLPEAGPSVRLYRTRKRQDFHTDGADIIGLLCLHGARSGGESRIVSSGAVYNEILRRRPDLLEVLYQPMCWDFQGDDAAGGQPWFTLAPITDVGGVPRIFYLGWYIRDAQRHAQVPRLTAAQLEAMELLEEIANDPEFHIEMAFEPGDIQLLNNGRILHAREAYEDDDDPARRRHLLRLWLAAHSFASLEASLRQGMAAPR